MKLFAYRDMLAHPRKGWVSLEVFDDNGRARIKRVETSGRVFEWTSPDRSPAAWCNLNAHLTRV